MEMSYREKNLLISGCLGVIANLRMLGRGEPTEEEYTRIAPILLRLATETRDEPRMQGRLIDDLVTLAEKLMAVVPTDGG